MNERYGWGTFWMIMGATDVVPIRSLAMSVGKVGWRGLVRFGPGLSTSWSAAKSWMIRRGWRDFKGQQFHHWLITQAMVKTRPWLAPFAHQPWNMVRLGKNAVESQLIHTSISTNLGYRLIFGTPTWAKAATASATSRAFATPDIDPSPFNSPQAPMMSDRSFSSASAEPRYDNMEGFLTDFMRDQFINASTSQLEVSGDLVVLPTITVTPDGAYTDPSSPAVGQPAPEPAPGPVQPNPNPDDKKG